MRFFFFFNDTATTEIYTLSLHDALPILGNTSRALSRRLCFRSFGGLLCLDGDDARGRIAVLEERALVPAQVAVRSEEHTSELQSQSNLVCRLLLEKKKQTTALTSAPVTR